MKTKTKNSSRGVLAVSIIIAVVLGTIQQVLVAVPSHVQASDLVESYSNFSHESESRQEQVVSLRDAMMKSMTKKIDAFVVSFSSYGFFQNESSIGGSGSNDEINTLAGGVLATQAVCIPSQVSDINKDKYQQSIEWALDHCLVQGYEDGKFHTDKNINHNEMLIIAQRAGYRVDLAQGSEQVVTRSELLRFIDYLQASKQIGLIPGIEFNTIIRRGEYINFLYAIDDGKVQEVSENNRIENKDITSSDQLTPTKEKTSVNMSIAEFKTLLNKSLPVPLAIEEYDDKIIVTEEIMKIILEQSTKQDGTQVVKEEDNGLGKEAVKTLLNWFMEKL